MPDFTDSDDVSRWLVGTTPRYYAAVASRAALRSIPALSSALYRREARTNESRIILPVFRGASLAWATARFAGLSGNASVRAQVLTTSYNLFQNSGRSGEIGVPAVFVSSAVRSALSVTDAASGNIAAQEAIQAGVDSYASFGVEECDQDYYAALADDLEWASRNNGAEDLAGRPLWTGGEVPPSVLPVWTKLKMGLLELSGDWSVWTDWYGERLRGDPGEEGVELARASLANEVWHQGARIANRHIADLTGFRRPMPSTRREAPEPVAQQRQLSEVVSPAPSLTADDLLDAGPNIVYDAPDASLELPSLPIRQCALIQTILVGLPAQAPKHLKSSLESYEGELKIRGVQPILGLLNDMAAIIQADIGDPNARREWLAAGLAAAFQKFQENHELFARHFPLDLKRDELYASIAVDEAAAVGPPLAKPFEDVAKATKNAHNAGLATDDFLKIVGGLTEFARICSTQPAPQTSIRETARVDTNGVGEFTVNPEDRIGSVSSKKRAILSGIGFFERVYNLIGSTASLVASSEGAQLMAAVTSAIQSLLKFLG